MSDSPRLRLSAPVYHTRHYFQSDPVLATKIISLVNDAFARSKKLDPVKWGEDPHARFTDTDMYLDMLGPDGIVAVLFDEDTRDRKVVATAAAIPWRGGWKKEGAGTEEGWEIKAVAVDGDSRYLRRGLAMQLYKFLEQSLIINSRCSGVSTTGRPFQQRDQLILWILAAECINGVYWRKRGYELVRKEVHQAPTWGVLTSFEMVVLQKVVPFELSKSGSAVDSAIRSDAATSIDVEVP
ncbi:hypothetical protein E8E13_005613 [Curvularia kusanoi]|uniref:Uncharacterized protein n=1 Tax=Curvularia kusanoi TaxID=90978 RepID=A0A9P4T8X1_CURKU|nr:hypothetical protein E8E13_005613 [Curvularia kusanoi]